MKIESIPSIEDWGILDDLDAQYAFEIFYGKNIDDAVLEFHKNLFERSSELRFVPDKVFNYYIFGLKKYIESDLLADEDKADAVSIFLDLIENKSESNLKSLISIYPDIYEFMKKIANNQDFFCANVDIYGDFKSVVGNIEKRMNNFEKNYRFM